jgi:hypothetical protein
VLYEFLRNQKLDANNYFNTARQPYHQNQFGATLGGRIIRDNAGNPGSGGSGLATLLTGQPNIDRRSRGPAAHPR